MSIDYKTDEIDFSPFNAEEVLRALCNVLRTSKHLFFGYAGDIQSLVDRIGRVFFAGRAIFFVNSKKDTPVEVFEYLKGEREALAHLLSSPFAQKFVEELVGLPSDVMTVDDRASFAAEFDGDFAEFAEKFCATMGDERFHLIPLRLYVENKSQTAASTGAPGSGQGGASPSLENERRTGLLLLQEADKRVSWNKMVLDSFAVIADHLARLAQIETLSDKLAALEELDCETGLLHRTAIQTAVVREIERASFYGDSLAILVIAVDNPRREVTGLAQSREHLLAVSSVVSSSARAFDLVGRFAADQFMLCVPRMERAEAERTGERLRSQINAALLQTTARAKQQSQNESFALATASVSVVMLKEDGRNFDELLAVSRDLLSAAQSVGGNCVKVRKLS